MKALEKQLSRDSTTNIFPFNKKLEHERYDMSAIISRCFVLGIDSVYL